MVEILHPYCQHMCLFLRSRDNLSVHRHASNVLQFSFGAACLPELWDLVIASRLHADLAWESVNVNASICHVSMICQETRTLTSWEKVEHGAWRCMTSGVVASHVRLPIIAFTHDLISLLVMSTTITLPFGTTRTLPREVTHIPSAIAPCHLHMSLRN